MAEPLPFSNRDKARAAQRELALRKSAYPGWVDHHRMTAKEAAREIALMQAIANDYAELAEAEEAALGLGVMLP